ncbi:MAG: outer membrane protein assembly factor BamB family protein [Ktedonobacteraceae bacterium]
MKQTSLRKLTVLPLLSLTLFTLLCISSIFLQGSASAFAASHNQSLSTKQVAGEHPHIPNGGTLICNYLDTPNAQPFYSSPTVVNGIIYVGSVDHYVYALYASTCTLDWRYKTNGPVYSSPTVFNGVLYIGSDDHFAYALNAATGAFIWKHNLGNIVRSSPVTNGQFVYIGSNNHRVYALNTANGNVIWSHLTGGPVTSSPRLYGSGKILYIGSQDHKVYALNGYSGALIWSYTTGNAINRSSAAIAVVGSTTDVFIGSTDTKLYALNAFTGAFNCSFTASGPVESSPTVATVGSSQIVYVGSDGTGSPPSNNGYFYALNAATCTQIWSYLPPAGPTRNWVIDTPTVAAANGVVTVYFGSLDHSVFALDAGLGTLIWTYATGNYVDSSPTVVNGVLYIGSNDGNLYELTA